MSLRQDICLATTVQWIPAAVKVSSTVVANRNFPTDFAHQKLAKGDYVTRGHCRRRKYESITKHLNFDGVPGGGCNGPKGGNQF